MTSRRTVGVEEELLLVDATTGRARALAREVLARAARDGDTDRGHATDAEPSGGIEGELQQEQIETQTPPVRDLGTLGAELRRWRRRAAAAAEPLGCGIAAVGLSPLPVDPHPATTERYQRMARKFGLTSEEQLTCGCHVHVSVSDVEEGVAVLDRLRVWLPVLLAMSAGSPFWDGRETGYASYRSQCQLRWPSGGPVDLFGSAAAYRRVVDAMLASGVLLDAGMLYFDARLSTDYPTVEIRVADVCLDADDAVLVAALCRALVDTAAASWRAGDPAPDASTSLVRLASWQAARFGVDGDLLDPRTGTPRPAQEVLRVVLDHVGASLERNGDLPRVDEGFARVRSRGTGATRMREVMARTGRLEDVVAEAVLLTMG